MRHITQPDDKTCVSACLAMVLGRDVDEVIVEFHKAFMSNIMRPAEYIRRNGKLAREFSGLERVMMVGNVYLLAVPSLNREATLHSVVCDTRGDSLEILDPRKDGEHKYYVYDKYDDPLAIQMNGFVIDVEVIGG